MLVISFLKPAVSVFLLVSTTIGLGVRVYRKKLEDSLHYFLSLKWLKRYHQLFGNPIAHMWPGKY